MYEELIAKLRGAKKFFPGYLLTAKDFRYELMPQDLCEAADAIEDLQKQIAKSEADNINLTGWLAEEHAKHQWIPVTEQRPANNMDVLIFYEWTGRSDTVYREVQIASIEQLENDPSEMFRPIAWMPLPEPPESEDE